MNWYRYVLVEKVWMHALHTFIERVGCTITSTYDYKKVVVFSYDKMTHSIIVVILYCSNDL